MKILQISQKIPFPPLDGGSIVINSLTSGLLKAGHSVKMLCMTSPKRAVDPKTISLAYRNSVSLETVPIDTQLKIWPALKNLIFDKESYHTVRFKSPKFAKKLKTVLQNESFDIIQMESIFVSGYLNVIKKYSKAKIVLRTQNVEHIIWEGITENEENIFKKAYLKIMTRRLKSYEIAQFKSMNAIVPVTEVDATITRKYLPATIRVKAIPFSFVAKKMEVKDSQADVKPGTIFHLGSMDWFPNLEAVRWFLEKVWEPFDLDERSTLCLAGKFMPADILKKADENLIVEGSISDPVGYMSDKEIMVVPLLSGSGIRVKIIEGMAMGKVVISTTLGAKGIDCEHQKNILIADTPQAFYNAIIDCINHPERCESIRQEARILANEKYNEQLITQRFIDFYNEQLLEN